LTVADVAAGICAEYRAASHLDRADDAADRDAGRKLRCPEALVASLERFVAGCRPGGERVQVTFPFQQDPETMQTVLLGCRSVGVDARDRENILRKISHDVQSGCTLTAA
jgi:hypothetical protein